MHRPISILLAFALLIATVSPAASEDAVVMKRDRKGMILWGALFVANSALLSLGLSDLGRYKDEGVAAQSRGENPDPYWENYDRAGWIVAGAGAAAVISGVGLIQATRLRPVHEEPLRFARPRPAPQDVQIQGAIDPAFTEAGRAQTGLTAPDEGTAPVRSTGPDPIAAAIADIEKRAGVTNREGAAAASAPPAPVITGKVTTRQAWLPGTAVPSDVRLEPKEAPIEASEVAAASEPAITREPIVWEEPSEQTIVSDEPAAQSEPPATTESPSTTVPSTEPSTKPAASAEEDSGAPVVVERDTQSPSSVAVPSAPPAAEAKPSPRYYTVQVSSHKKPADAERDAGRWTSLGYPAEVVAKDLGAKGLWHRVVMGTFGRAADAEALAASLRGRFPAQGATVVRR